MSIFSPVARVNERSAPRRRRHPQIGSPRRSCQTMRVVQRAAAAALEDDDRLALVGDAEAREVGKRALRGARRLAKPRRARSARSPRRRARPSRAAGRFAGARAMVAIQHAAAGDRTAPPWWPTCSGRWRGCKRHDAYSRMARAAAAGGEAFHRDAVVAEDVGLAAGDGVFVGNADDAERHGARPACSSTGARFAEAAVDECSSTVMTARHSRPARGPPPRRAA